MPCYLNVIRDLSVMLTLNAVRGYCVNCLVISNYCPGPEQGSPGPSWD